MDTDNLMGLLRSFPSEDHVRTICTPGRGVATCRYLSLGEGGWSCAKSSSMRKMMDERVAKDQMGAKGDNCGGLFALIMENQQALVGKKVLYKESIPSYKAEGILRRMEMRNGYHIIVVSWVTGFDAGEERVCSAIKEDDLSMRVAVGSIVFEAAGLGSVGGSTTIVLRPR